jgi:ABC-type polysaccharide/polyol phosphate export permease
MLRIVFIMPAALLLLTAVIHTPDIHAHQHAGIIPFAHVVSVVRLSILTDDICPPFHL